jgi:hypothetical protein
MTSVLMAQKDIPQFKPEYELKKRLRFGILFGINTYGFNIDRKNNDLNLYADIPKLSAGFHVGIVTDLKLFSSLSLRLLPTVTFVTRQLSFYNSENEVYLDITHGMKGNSTVESIFLEFPLLFKFKSKRINNYQIYFVAGPDIQFDMSSPTSLNISEGKYISLEAMDYGYEIGVGLDQYLPYFKLSTELKFYSGFSNVLSDSVIEDADFETDIFIKSIDKLTTYGFKLSVHFE